MKFLDWLTLALIILKLCDIITCSWLLVFCPIFISITLSLIISIIDGIFGR